MATLILSTEAPTISGPPQGRWTLADWETLPDDGRIYEVINGVLYMSTAPSPLHQWIVQTLYDQIGFPAKQRGLGTCFFSPIGVIMPGCDPVQPDFVFIKPEHKGIVKAKRLEGIPDLIVEILSPGNRSYDEEVKFLAYAAAGVPEYAIIDSVARRVRYYALKSKGEYGPPHDFETGQSMSFACLPGILLEVGRLFEGAPDTTL